MYRSEGKYSEPIVYHIRQKELDALHPVLEVIMPDEVLLPESGSAHDWVQRLELKDSEYALVHTVDGGQVCDCAVALHLRSVNN